MSERVTVSSFRVVPTLLFGCVFCNTSIFAYYGGIGHISTGNHCPKCGAYYLIDWHEPVEESVIEMGPLYDQTQEYLDVNAPKASRAITRGT